MIKQGTESTVQILIEWITRMTTNEYDAFWETLNYYMVDANTPEEQEYGFDPVIESLNGLFFALKSVFGRYC